jgi:hypothetical protein
MPVRFDPSRAGTGLAGILIRSGLFAGPEAYPKALRTPIRCSFYGTLGDNDTNFVDLTQDIVDVQILRAANSSAIPDPTGNSALTPVDNPNVVVPISRAAFAFAEATENPEILVQYLHRNALVWRPSGGEAREVMLSEIFSELVAVAGISKPAAESTVYTSALRRVETHPLLRGELWPNLAADSFGIKPFVATNGAGAQDFQLTTESAAFSNQGWNANDVPGSCDESEGAIIGRLKSLAGRVNQAISVFGGKPRVVFQRG